MKKNIFILILAFIMIISYLIFDFYTFKTPSDPTQNDLSIPLKCDLNLKDCKYIFNGKEILVSLGPKPLQALSPLDLKIKNLGDYKNLALKIYGLNMYMGQISPKLHKLNQTDYESKIVLASCVLDTMRFRAEFTQDDKPIGFYFDFDLKR
ncbi:hypothetical protein LNU06_02435 [Campylobacter sp. VicNov18]|uniref:hypothetical protein n=1 Tax=Campylobacter bilis TaxID=2691918 RepID=UPI00130E4DA1|nr:hypothetical protein [Campylobacter bilis]MPV63508.1 hypothetical protein [Campylobacter hepaticus]MBM0637008.1 hypothetical protein [Campylobacter bilis]MCC8277837.1 hypothetical protein [Campylobacter bilis]MCC8299447.1 hypothetical protein [Campylobacter bilis]MCC8300747.1 hypothetical protein [Campylobacter bilis]